MCNIHGCLMALRNGCFVKFNIFSRFNILLCKIMCIMAHFASHTHKHKQLNSNFWYWYENCCYRVFLFRFASLCVLRKTNDVIGDLFFSAHLRFCHDQKRALQQYTSRKRENHYVKSDCDSLFPKKTSNTDGEREKKNAENKSNWENPLWKCEIKKFEMNWTCLFRSQQQQETRKKRKNNNSSIINENIHRILLYIFSRFFL